jgi:hypothetical protein
MMMMMMKALVLMKAMRLMRVLGKLTMGKLQV